MDVQTTLKMAQRYQQSGDRVAANKIYRDILEQEPENVEAIHGLAMLYLSICRDDMAIPLLVKVLTQQPNKFHVRLNLAKALHRVGRIDESLQCLEQALLIDQDNYNHVFSVANVYKELAFLELAEKTYLRAQSIDDSRYEAYVNLGRVYKDLGRINEAEEQLNKAIELNPGCAEALYTLAFMRKIEKGAELISQMELLERGRDELSREDRMYLAYGLGKAYEDIKVFDEAFEHMEEGNRLEGEQKGKFKGVDYAQFERIKKVFSEDFLARHLGSGEEDNAPIFIVGMPRSGTTLVEQILASHSKVYGAGELEDFRIYSSIINTITKKPFPEGIEGVDRGALRAMANQYLGKMKTLSGFKEHFTDKMPSNFMYIGLIALVFPNARIIHCQRNPMDTCLSIFRNSFTGSFQYSHDLTSLGDFYSEYQKVMQHWHKVLPYKIYDVVYEDLVTNTEEEIRYMLNFCQLPFEEACLNFHQTDRQVITSSATQVRQPISTASVSAWKRYEKQLEPLRIALQ